MHIKKPNFDHSTLSLINSILKHYNYQSQYQTLDKLNSILLSNPDNIVLFILDGLGNNYLKKNVKKWIFINGFVESISSVFPSTTVASINTIQSGVSPSVNGWLGWTMFFNECNRTIEVFKNKYVGYDDQVLFDYKSKINYENIFY